MSKSRSTTPTTNTAPTNSPSFSIPSTSRRQTHDNTTSIPPLGARDEQTPTFIHSSLPEASSSSLRRPATSPAPDQPMAKHLRLMSPHRRPRRGSRSSPSTDSQGGMADTEERSQRSEKSPPPSAPPKKKRTRTLTTPHQSAVLHALLAQSRFPTTAMREEVGRSIGLSARKVQIWFQNQRQKARRPRSQSDTPLTRPPQYGPFPAPESLPVSPYTMGPERGFGGESQYAPWGRYGMGEEASAPEHVAYSLDAYARPREAPPRLLGPGMPGLEGRGSSQYTASPPHHPDAGPSSATRPHTAQPYSGSYMRRTPSPPRGYPQHHLPHQTRPTTGPSEREFSRTLPPLVFGQPPHSREQVLPPLMPRPEYPSYSAPATMRPMTSRHTPSPESLFAHRLPPAEPFSHSIPPPFALQPQPQWNPSLFSSANVPPTAWSRPSTSTHGGSSPESPQRSVGTTEPESGRSPSSHGEASHRPRSGRYDPVRATVVPFTPGAPPSSQSSEDHHD